MCESDSGLQCGSHGGQRGVEFWESSSASVFTEEMYRVWALRHNPIVARKVASGRLSSG